MRLTEQQLFDYISCPARYDIKYNRKIDIKESVSLPKLLNKVAKYFYLNLFNGKVCSTNELKSKWDSICKANADYMDSKKVLAGWGTIINLYNWAAKNRIAVMDIDTQYRFLVGETEVVGQMEPILGTASGGMEILITNFSDKIPDQVDSDIRMKYTLDAMAFNRTYNQEISGIRIHSIKSDRDTYTSRGPLEFKRLETAIRSVAKGIQNEVYFPHEGPLCTSCTAREYCKYWHK